MNGTVHTKTKIKLMSVAKKKTKTMRVLTKHHYEEARD